MTLLTFAEAARTVGVGRTTIYRKVESGELSSVQNHKGKSRIDPSELIRVFGELKSDGKTKRSNSETTGTTGGQFGTLLEMPEKDGGHHEIPSKRPDNENVQALKDHIVTLKASLASAEEEIQRLKQEHAAAIGEARDDRKEFMRLLARFSERQITDQRIEASPSEPEVKKVKTKGKGGKAKKKKN